MLVVDIPSGYIMLQVNDDDGDDDDDDDDDDDVVAGGDDKDDHEKTDNKGYQSFYDSLDSFSLIMLFKD